MEIERLRERSELYPLVREGLFLRSEDTAPIADYFQRDAREVLELFYSYRPEPCIPIEKSLEFSKPNGERFNGKAPTPYGEWYITCTETQIIAASFVEQSYDFKENNALAEKLTQDAFSEGVCIAPENLTPFAASVWGTLISCNGVTTYGNIARAVGKPMSSRAVGGVMAKNKLVLLLPCHRVIRSDSTLGGYAFGLELKRIMLFCEDIGLNTFSLL